MTLSNGCLLLVLISFQVFAQTIKQGGTAGYAPLGVGANQSAVLLHEKWIKVEPTAVISPRPLNAFPARVPKSMVDGMTNPAVLLIVTVGAEGRIHETKVVRSVTKKLDQIAMNTARHWNFEPARYMNQPVGVRIIVEVDFNTA